MALFSQCLFLHPAWQHIQRLCRHEVLRSTALWLHSPHGRVDGRLRAGPGVGGRCWGPGGLRGLTLGLLLCCCSLGVLHDF